MFTLFKEKFNEAFIIKRYIISNIPSNVCVFSIAVRTNWSVETMHWHLDVSFDEDDTRIKNKEILENPAIINRIVLGILQLVKPTSFTNRSIKNIRNLIDYKPEKYITQIFSLLSKIKKEEEK